MHQRATSFIDIIAPSQATLPFSGDPVPHSSSSSLIPALVTFPEVETRADDDSSLSSNSGVNGKGVSLHSDHLKDIHEIHAQIQTNDSLSTPLETDIEPPEVVSSPTQQGLSSRVKSTVPSPEDSNISMKDELHPAVGTIETLPHSLRVVNKDLWNSSLDLDRAQEQQDQDQQQAGREDLNNTSYDLVEPFSNPHPPIASALAPLRSSSDGSLSAGTARSPSPHQEMPGSDASKRKNLNLNHHNNSSNHLISTPPAMGISKALPDLPHAYQHLTSTRHPHQTHHHQHTESSDTTATMEMIAPSRPGSGMEQHPSMSSLAPSTMVLHDIENSNVRKEIKETGKGRRISGWLSRWTTGGGDKDRDHDHGPREQSQSWQLVHPEEQGGELTKLIGFLTATSSKDWALVLDVCERASASDSNAKEAIRALRREFKYGAPQAQLSAARLWAIMLRNSTDTLIGQSTSRKFLETLEELLVSPRTNPVVKERVLDILAAAAVLDIFFEQLSLPFVAIFVLSPGCTRQNAKFGAVEKDTGFRGLWKKVKPHDKPDEGMPFDTDDAMFNPPTGGDRRSYSESLPHQQPQLHPDHHHHHPGRQEQNPNQPHNSLDGDLPVEANGDATEKDKENSKEGKQQEHDPERSGSQVRRDSNHDHEPREKDRDNKDQSQPAGLDHDEKTCSSRKDKNRDPRDSNRERDLEPRERDKDKDRSHREHRDRDRGKDKDRERSSRKDKDRESRKRKKHRSSRERERDAQKIIPPEEDIRRLFCECIIGKGNASLLSQALVHTTLEDFLSDNTEGQSNGIIREFRVKCITSQELIAAQIPWASAGSERSRRELNAKREAEGKPIAGEENGETTEEKLLADLLGANEELLAALGKYEDLESVAGEKKAEEDSKKGIEGRRARVSFFLLSIGRMNLTNIFFALLKQDEIEGQLHQEEPYLSPSHTPPMSTRSPSPSLHTSGARAPPRSPPLLPTPAPPRISSPGGRPNPRPLPVIFGGGLTSGHQTLHNHPAPPHAPRETTSLALRGSIPAGSFDSSADYDYVGNGA
ncbi:hypothetical protein AAF712_011265 [Marasmius tenuissimus]|uniref:VHS domain-containing protein n=1 Tax=Marasmius tenuissimus TaxID=585030 RepID=A0ABR2ZLP9_9AGAR